MYWSVNAVAEIDMDWHVGLAGCLLDELEFAAVRWQDQRYSTAQRLARRCAGVHSTGLASLLDELSIAANRAAVLSPSPSWTAFLFADSALAESFCALRRSPRVVSRVEHKRVTGVLTHPGFHRRSRKIVAGEELMALVTRTNDDMELALEG
jgi:hypothetical protein